jgi:hypothetical protein
LQHVLPYPPEDRLHILRSLAPDPDIVSQKKIGTGKTLDGSCP